MSATVTLRQPSEASRRAIASPSPCAAPVTMAVRLSSLPISLLRGCGHWFVPAHRRFFDRLMIPGNGPLSFPSIVKERGATFVPRAKKSIFSREIEWPQCAFKRIPTDCFKQRSTALGSLQAHFYSRQVYALTWQGDREG